MWGGDWPHTGGSARPANPSMDAVEPFRAEDAADDLDPLAASAPDAALRKLILVDTPVRIDGFS